MPILTDIEGLDELLENVVAAPSFEFAAGPYQQGQLHVVSFEGTEGISELFSFDLVLSAETGLVSQPEEDLLAQPA